MTVVTQRDNTTADAWAMLDVDQVDPAPDNPRRDLGDLTELATSIQAHGVLEPLLVTPRDQRYLLVCGARRHAAAILADLQQVPCIIKHLDEPARISAMIIENVQRSSLQPLEEAIAYQRLLDATGMTQRDLEQLVGTSQATISKRLALLELPDEARAAVDSQRITLRQAGELHKLVQAGAGDRAADLTRKHIAGELPHWQPLEDQIEQAVAEVTVASRTEQSLQELKDRKARILTEPKQGWWDKQPRPLDGQEHAACVFYQHVNVDLDAHATDGCHAATICTRHGEIVWMCNDPKLHATDEDRQRLEDRERLRQKNDDRLAAERGAQKALGKAAKARVIVARQLLEQDVGAGRGQYSPGQLLNDLIRLLVDRSHVDVAKVVCELLNLEPTIEVQSWGGTYKDWRKPLERLIDQGDVDRVGSALMLGDPESHLRNTWSGWGGARKRRYLDRLQAAGYELTAAERAKLEQAQADAAEDAATDLEGAPLDDEDGEDLDEAGP